MPARTGPSAAKGLTLLAIAATVLVALHSGFLGWQTDGSREALYESSLARLLGWAAGLAVVPLVVGAVARISRRSPRPAFVAGLVSLAMLAAAEGWVYLRMTALRPDF